MITIIIAIVIAVLILMGLSGILNMILSIVKVIGGLILDVVSGYMKSLISYWNMYLKS